MVEEEEKHEGGEKGLDVTVFDLRELSGMDNGDEEMDGEPDTTGDDQAINTQSSRQIKTEMQREPRWAERLSYLPSPERNKSS